MNTRKKIWIICSPIILLIVTLSISSQLGCTEYERYNPSYCASIESAAGINVHWSLFFGSVLFLALSLLAVPILLVTLIKAMLAPKNEKS